ncbi:MAG: hypothetical protein ACLR95_17305 [Enterococcus avium]
MEELARRFWEISQTAYAFDSPWTISQFVSDMRQSHSHYFSEETEIIAFLGFHQVCDEIEITNIASEIKGQGHGKKANETLDSLCRVTENSEYFSRSTCFESRGASFL